jgi:hypothetical protein
VTETEIAFRAAINLLRDSVESRRMPSGELLQPDGVALLVRAADHLETLLSQALVKPRP